MEVLNILIAYTLLTPHSSPSPSDPLPRRGYIAPRHESDHLSGCVVARSEAAACARCGDTEAGDSVRRYEAGHILEVVLQFLEPDYTTTNSLGLCSVLHGKFRIISR